CSTSHMFSLRAEGGIRARTVSGVQTCALPIYFVSASAALAASSAAPVSFRRPARADGLVVLFQGDSITDAGRDRQVSEPNLARGLGSGYPLLVAAAALAAHPDRALRFYNRGVSGDKVPDLASRWATDTLALAPDVL